MTPSASFLISDCIFTLSSKLKAIHYVYVRFGNSFTILVSTHLQNFRWSKDSHDYQSGVNQHFAVRNTEPATLPYLAGSILSFLKFHVIPRSLCLRKQRREKLSAERSHEAVGLWARTSHLREKDEIPHPWGLGAGIISHRIATIIARQSIPRASLLGVQSIQLQSIRFWGGPHAWFPALLSPPWNFE